MAEKVAESISGTIKEGIQEAKDFFHGHSGAE